ncbi:sensor histidine kinase [Celeribacter marinus]|uniref:sensor histidine kinase n=1 Tax=Celeribacter marinus TaxID=1397108 RepID=UPI00317EEC2D
MANTNDALFETDLRSMTSRFERPVMKIRTQIVILLVATVAILTASLQYMNYRNFYNEELDMVRDKHLVIANNLSLTLSRYVNDVGAVFNSWETPPKTGSNATQYMNLMAAFDIDRIFWTDQKGSVQKELSLVADDDAPRPWSFIEAVRTTPSTQSNEIQISGIQKIGETRYFILAKALENGTVLAGYLNTDYIKSIQEEIAFGELGHSAIFDQDGRAIAHPNPTVEANMMDGSKITIVQKMLSGETGVDQFYSPPMKIDMIAGYTFVPETGWAVMVPQPIGELKIAVNKALADSYSVAALAALIVTTAGLMFAHRLTAPIQYFTKMSARISDGDFTTTLPNTETSSYEMQTLNASLRNMAFKVHASNEHLKHAIELEAKDSARKDTLLLTASHELRTPLNGITGMLMACKHDVSNPDTPLYIQLALESAQKLDRIVSDMLTVAEGENHRLKIQTETIDLPSELNKMMRWFSVSIIPFGVSIQHDFSNIIMRHINTDKTRLAQILTNLVSNSANHAQCSLISVSATIIAEKSPNLHTLELTVADNGIGIPEEFQQEVFDPFFQIEKSFSRSSDGLGVGLTIVRDIVTALNGTIKMTSEVGIGTSFTIRVPIELAEG